MTKRFWRCLFRVVFYDEDEKRVFVEIPSFKYDVAFAIPLDSFPENMKEKVKVKDYRFHAMAATDSLEQIDMNEFEVKDYEEK